MLGFEEIFRGTIDGANVYSREIVRQTLLYNAASILVAHKHRSNHNRLIRERLTSKRTHEHPQPYPQSFSLMFRKRPMRTNESY
jgi:hypothetical protein